MASPLVLPRVQLCLQTCGSQGHIVVMEHSCNQAHQLAVTELQQCNSNILVEVVRCGRQWKIAYETQTLKHTLLECAARCPSPDAGRKERWSPAIPPHGLLPPEQRCTIA